ncbi:uncharacterized protein LTR77_009642 [Saxophila tyrrhenica]|uniref:Uncharacterized protein n=1 Tax=Saxophila tyrrhenica TaxID=1690608 RepID=A0AAV9P233_9PEZI|nr:hypothetical protein LTR77_009642 [Saxophila tyrrhenica]
MSRDSGSPVSRPGSAAVSHSNGSVAFSQAGSTTPIFARSTPPPLAPNKLVKRSSSLRSTNGSPRTSSGSKLPVPVLKRPATSHQRSVTMQEMYSGGDQSDHMSIDEKSVPPRDPQLVNYFTPTVQSDAAAARRRSSTGIPSPINRIYPDRKYRPVLVSASRGIRQGQIEMDAGLSDGEGEGEVTRLTVAPSYGSSPLPQQTSDFGQGQTPKRSFSIGDLLATGPQPLWRRPSLNKSKTASKLARRSRPRVVSAPQAAMGGAFSSNQDGDSDRPAKRRDLTDPAAARRSIYSSASNNTRIGSSPAQEIDLDLGTSTPQSFVANDGVPHAVDVSPEQTSSPLEQRRLPSATAYSATVRPVRVSAAQSEITSTVGSDSEYRSIGDASTDYQSDAVYDSYPTRTTRSSSGKRGPHIETIFDESPPHFSSGRSTRLKDLLSDGGFHPDEHSVRYRHSTIEEEESITSTPVRSLRDNSVTSTPSGRSGLQHRFTSSPPVMSTMPDPDEIDWDAPDDEPPRSVSTPYQSPATNGANGHAARFPFQFGPALPDQQSESADTTPFRHNGAASDRANLFEWSETQPSPSQNDSPPRPRTVHGKKDQENRGSRSTGRRAPSGMHARSHSVPVVPDVEGKRNNVVANKFGTWGVGSKVVTEDWNEDFDFDEMLQPLPEQLLQDDKRIDSGHEMFVPKSIREQQESVMSNIRLLKEWGMAIEELKELRVRAVALDMMNGPYAHAWEEVDAMIELADQESEEKTLEPRRSPPSSPGFDYDDFDEPMPSIAEATRPRGQSFGVDQTPPQTSDLATEAGAEQRPMTPQEFIVTRPRKDSEAVAKSVIEAIQSKRSVSEPHGLKPASAAKKVPFDTATLRHIVPYVKDLKRKVKDALRETEGLYSSPHRTKPHKLMARHDEVDEPAFKSIFDSPGDQGTVARRRSRRDQARTDHDGMDTDLPGRDEELASQMEDMKFDE